MEASCEVAGTTRTEWILGCGWMKGVNVINMSNSFADEGENSAAYALWGMSSGMLSILEDECVK